MPAGYTPGSGKWIRDHCSNIPKKFRPEWKAGVSKGFKRAHFDARDDGTWNFLGTYITLDGLNAILKATKVKEISLNHVLSWHAIKSIMSDLLQNIHERNQGDKGTRGKQELVQFIDRLFAIDEHAYVHTISSVLAFQRIPESHAGDYKNQNAVK